MRVELRSDGILWITPESVPETIALFALEKESNSKGFYLPPYIAIDAPDDHCLTNLDLAPADHWCCECGNQISESQAAFLSPDGSSRHAECPSDESLEVARVSNMAEQLLCSVHDLGVNLNKRETAKLKKSNNKILGVSYVG